ncbi:MAG: cytochrome b561 [Paraglaciecola sp.]
MLKLLKDTSTSYGWMTIIAHWLTGVVVVSMFTVGLWMVDLDYYSQWYKTAPHYHKSAGLVLALFTIVRILWKMKQISPKTLGENWERRIAKIAHWLLYVLLGSMFFSGYLISTADGRGIDVFNWFMLPSLGEIIDNQEDVAGQIHEWIAYGLIGLASFHALAALKHHILDKDQTLIRMLKPQLTQSYQQKDKR